MSGTESIDHELTTADMVAYWLSPAAESEGPSD